MFAQPLYAVDAEKGLNCDQTYFLFLVTFVGPNDYPSDSVSISGLLLNLHGVGFKPGLCREFSGSGKAGHGSSVSLGGWDWAAQVLAGGGVGFGLQRSLAGVQLSQRGTLFTKLWTVISLSQKCLA